MTSFLISACLRSASSLNFSRRSLDRASSKASTMSATSPVSFSISYSLRRFRISCSIFSSSDSGACVAALLRGSSAVSTPGLGLTDTPTGALLPGFVEAAPAAGGLLFGPLPPPNPPNPPPPPVTAACFSSCEAKPSISSCVTLSRASGVSSASIDGSNRLELTFRATCNSFKRVFFSLMSRHTLFLTSRSARKRRLNSIRMLYMPSSSRIIWRRFFSLFIRSSSGTT
mmetsp:Transcript_24330/g.67639  ORF Transcript_24330/g.67639 Transcript_24330/m.67639 type:complete len:228 (+) Transcript_24330:1476-2159(+)